jgi:hypothetical protein
VCSRADLGRLRGRVQCRGDGARELHEPAGAQPHLAALELRNDPGRPAVGPRLREPEEPAARTVDFNGAAPVRQEEQTDDREPAATERMAWQRHRDVVRTRRTCGCIL